MTADPAVAAWERAAAKTSPLDALAAAREALAPLRARHRAGYGFKLPRRKGDRPEAFCEACHVKWPCEDATYLYPEDEL